MLGRTHALSGWCAGLAVAPLVGLHTITEVVPFAAASAGFALLPDLDHPGASASRFLGPVTGLLSCMLRACSRAVYRWTRGARDEDCDGTHRHLTHTVLFAVLLGVLAASFSEFGGGWVVAGVIGFGLLLAADVLGDWVIVVSGGAAAITAAGGGLAGALAASAGWVGIAVMLGCVVHCLGDAITLSGCPFLWPIPIAGETWYELRPPRFLRFRTGGRIETWLMFPVFAAAGVLLLPGVWPAAVQAAATIAAS